LGSTGERVLRKALVPVLVARKPLTAEAKRFLVPTDFSAGAQKAAEEALVLAKSFSGRIFFLHVLDLTLLYAYDYGSGVAAYLSMPPLTPEDFEADWESFLSTLPLGEIPWEKRTEEGSAAKTIVRHAEAIQADAIVMGTHGRGGLEQMLLGSVAEAVTRAAPCPVLTVRPAAFQFRLP
jgi:nucleotide-binding universal stress UspA family protein